MLPTASINQWRSDGSQGEDRRRERSNVLSIESLLNTTTSNSDNSDVPLVISTASTSNRAGNNVSGKCAENHAIPSSSSSSDCSAPLSPENQTRVTYASYPPPTDRYRPYPELVTSAALEHQEQLPRQQHSVQFKAKSAKKSQQQQQQQQQQKKRRRRTQACQYCHLKKIKCEGDDTRCNNCKKNDVQCTWGLKRKRGPKPKATADTLSKQPQQPPTLSAKPKPFLQQAQPEGSAPYDQADDSSSMSPAASSSSEPPPHFSQSGSQQYLSRETPENIRLKVPQMDREIASFFSDKVVDRDTRLVVRYYFDYFYPLCPMFHPSMFIRRVVNGSVEPLLLDAMRAAAAPVINRMTGSQWDARRLADEVKSRILLHLESPTIDIIRAVVIMTLVCGSYGEDVSYNSLICLAASLVVKMGWHKMDLYSRAPPDDWELWAKDEIKRRVFWLIYQTDSYQAMLTGRPMTIPENNVYVQAPCSDYEWDVLVRPAVPEDSMSTSSPASVAHSPHNVVDAHAIVTMGAFSFSFMALGELTAIIARINTFLNETKTCRPSHSSYALAGMSPADGTTTANADNGPLFPAIDFMRTGAKPQGSLVHPVHRTTRVLGEMSEFVVLDRHLESWKGNLLLPENLRDDATEAADITYFGVADHRRFMMRVRYFCLHCYYVPITLFLHQSNRPSFFTEYEEPLERRLREYASNDADRTLREMVNDSFSSTWNEGLLAYDIEPSSWERCVRAANGLSAHLERNSDFPLERFDQIVPFCIFMSISVLIRHVRMTTRLLTDRNKDALTLAGGRQLVSEDRCRCVRNVKQQWGILQRLGSYWDVGGIELLLKNMQIDEVTSAADLLSEMSL